MVRPYFRYWQGFFDKHRELKNEEGNYRSGGRRRKRERDTLGHNIIGEAIDAELRLLPAIRRMVREAEGPTPNTARIDALLDERSSPLPPTPGESPASE